MTDNGKWMSLNGNWIPEDKSSHLFHNRGFLYGDGFFESMRFENGRIRSGEAHMHRLHRSLLLLEMSDASFPDLESLETQLGALAEKNKFGAHVRARISVFREGPGIYTPEVNKTSYLINMSQLEGPLRFPETGLRIGYYTRQAKARGPFSNIKSLSAQLYVMAGLHARKEGLDELLLINTSGHFIEGITSNVFIVYNGTLLTPPLTEGCVDGVMRKTLLNLA
ncbi:MAG: aminotransferase class IV, partial [Bacteroidia bacterium]|nr:aminotransferase class IV [Bacteroidia bacterium]